MASRKFPFDRGSAPGRDGFIRIPEGGGGGASGGRSRAAINADLKKYGMDDASRAVKNAAANRAFLKNLHAATMKEKRLAKIERARNGETDKSRGRRVH